MANEPATYQPTPDRPRTMPRGLYPACALAIAVGLITFLIGATRPDPAPAWRALLVNFLFWSSVAQGAFIWAVAFRLARTTWSAPINRLGLSFIGFFPVGIIVLIVLFFGRNYYLPWIGMDLGDRRLWLNVPFVFLRDGVGLLALFVLGLAYVRTYLVVDQATTRPEHAGTEEIERASRRLSVLGILLALVYFAVYTLLAFDLAMSLIPTWHSTLFGWYFALGGLYVGMAALIVMAVTLRRWLGVAEQIGPARFLDLGNLLMAFAMAMTYFFFAQALVIWYENLPHEVSFAIPRVNFQPGRTLSWLVVGTCYLGPFALLVVREMKENPRTLLPVALLAMVGMWLERYMLVMPSLATRPGEVPLLTLLIGIGFLGIMVSITARFLARYPAQGALDLVLEKD